MLNGPDMSVIVITPDRLATVRRTIKHLRTQTVAGRLELVIVAPSSAELELNEQELRVFFSFRVVEVGPMVSTARARAAGIRAASAPVVALVEDHAFPAPGWAEALIEAHQERWAAVGPVMVNANPRSAVSWANFLIEYAEWSEPVEGGVSPHLPGHNGSYKRDVLLSYGQQLEAMIDAESILHWDLREKGYELYLEPRARTFHQNFSAAFSWLPLRFHGGRLFASSRARRWSVARRLGYACGSPLIPLVRLQRILGVMRKSDRLSRLRWRVLPVLALGLSVDAFGELIGYAAGAGKAMTRLSDMEFHRDRYLTRSDRRAEVEV